MSRIYTDNDLGSWLTPNRKTGEEGGYVQVNIIEFSDGFARTVGTNIPLDEFEANYKRADEISAGPWANLNMSDFGVSAELISEIVETNDVNIVERKNIYENNTSTSASVQQLHSKTILDVETNESPEHQLIRNAIKLSKKTSEVTIGVDYTIPFDVEKIKTIMSTMEITEDIIVDVLISHIKQHPEGFFIAIEKSLKKMFNEPDVKEEK